MKNWWQVPRLQFWTFSQFCLCLQDGIGSSLGNPGSMIPSWDSCSPDNRPLHVLFGHSFKVLEIEPAWQHFVLGERGHTISPPQCFKLMSLKRTPAWICHILSSTNFRWKDSGGGVSTLICIVLYIGLGPTPLKHYPLSTARRDTENQAVRDQALLGVVPKQRDKQT